MSTYIPQAPLYLAPVFNLHPAQSIFFQHSALARSDSPSRVSHWARWGRLGGITFHAPWPAGTVPPHPTLEARHARVRK